MINEIIKEAEQRMSKTIEALHNELKGVRTGRANTSLLDGIMVDYYGSASALNQVANVSVQDSRTLTVTPWEKTMIEPIEKAIMTSNLGLNPVSAGMVIRIPLPPLTEERRKDLVKLVGQIAENSKIAIRNIRRDGNTQLKNMLNDKEITEDDLRGAEKSVQDVTDKFVQQVDDVIADKEKELMEI
ncbi:ribosome recycling factor [Marinicella sp. S1101]|uniref:ribosome recycling factor n=1 Tax=Marinicella marina TaxID=2996016 RepID=UPI00226085E3|nr:ribosome recycling factor [Marinicella marina]MCX7554807.1 ribosome recycling factor [Marinicella marina]MDJ1140960.1 ribosome recycling factor [Marinicella marina]